MYLYGKFLCKYLIDQDVGFPSAYLLLIVIKTKEFPLTLFKFNCTYYVLLVPILYLSWRLFGLGMSILSLTSQFWEFVEASSI